MGVNRKKIVVDVDIVNPLYTHVENSPNGVKYCLYKDNQDGVRIPEDPISEFKTSWTTGWCFGDLLYSLNRSRKDKGDDRVNRIFYKMELVPACITLTEKEKIRYVELCVKHKFLPEYIDSEESVNQNVLVMNLEGLTQAQLYVYLCMFRFIREDPGVVRSVVHLVDEVGMDFYASYVTACKVALNYSVHNFTELTRSYGENNKNLINTIKNIPLGVVISIIRFINDPQKYDKTGVYDSDRGFKGYALTQAASKVYFETSVQDLMDPILVEAMYSEDDAKAEELIKKFRELKQKVKYVEEA